MMALARASRSSAALEALKKCHIPESEKERRRRKKRASERGRG